MKTVSIKSMASLAAVLVCVAPFAASAQDSSVGDQVAAQLKEDDSNVSEVVAKAIESNPSSGCEIAKAAVNHFEGDEEKTAEILRAIATQEPSQLKPAAQCAKAVAPDASNAIDIVVASIDPSLGMDPLDFPTNGEQVIKGPKEGDPGGSPMLPAAFPNQPPFVNPSSATNNDVQ